MVELFWFIMGMVVITSIFIAYRNIVIYYKSNLPFKEIFELVEKGELRFQKRINYLVYFTGYKNLIIYNIEKHSISIHDDNNCIAVTNTTNKKISDRIINELDYKFYNDIYRKIFVVNGITCSDNMRNDTYPDERTQQKTIKDMEKLNNDSKPSVVFLLEEDVEGYVEKMDIETILTKVKRMGIESLNSKEISFLEDVDNWKVN